MSRRGVGQGAHPMTRARSAWVETPSMTIPGPHGQSVEARAWQRNVHDGHLLALVDELPGIGWHMSISHRTNTHPPRPGRYPSWDEIVDARDQLLPGEISFVMRLPVAEQYVAVHDTTFHLHQEQPPTATHSQEQP